jgi:hypothetical protein
MRMVEVELIARQEMCITCTEAECCCANRIASSSMESQDYPIIALHEALVPAPIGARETKTTNELAKRATPQPVPTALFQGLHAVIDNDAHELFGLAATLQFLEVRSRSERRGPRGAVASCILGFHDRGIREGRRGVIQAERGEDGGHVVVVGEVCVERAAEGEGGFAGIEGAVGRGVVVYGLVGQAGDELVGEAYALGWAEGVTVGVAVIFIQGLLGVRTMCGRLGSGSLLRSSCIDAILLR